MVASADTSLSSYCFDRDRLNRFVLEEADSRIQDLSTRRFTAGRPAGDEVFLACQGFLGAAELQCSD